MVERGSLYDADYSEFSIDTLMEQINNKYIKLYWLELVGDIQSCYTSDLMYRFSIFSPDMSDNTGLGKNLTVICSIEEPYDYSLKKRIEKYQEYGIMYNIALQDVLVNINDSLRQMPCFANRKQFSNGLIPAYKLTDFYHKYNLYKPGGAWSVPTIGPDLSISTKLIISETAMKKLNVQSIYSIFDAVGKLLINKKLYYQIKVLKHLKRNPLTKYPY